VGVGFGLGVGVWGLGGCGVWVGRRGGRSRRTPSSRVGGEALRISNQIKLVPAGRAPKAG